MNPGLRLLCVLVLVAGASTHFLLAQAPARDRDGAAADPGTLKSVIAAAKQQTAYTLSYDPAYRRIAYPGGDVPPDRGVCTDVIVRAFRAVGVDLQRLVHEDMSSAFRDYPQQWGLSRPDTNIDHRRVPNLMTFFERAGAALPVPRDSRAVLPGDIIAWRLGGGVLHIALASDERAAAGHVMFVHNIGRGARLEDILHAWPIIGHYRYFRSMR